MGPERKSRVITEQEKKIVAYHEAGHTVASYFTPRADRPYKVTIVPRGMAGGFTRPLPEDDRRMQDRSYYEAMMVFALGGHVSEEMTFGEMTTGAHDDIGKVTQIARNMVTQWGMSARLGPRTFGRRTSMIFLGRDISEERDYSDRTAEEIDDEVRRIIDEAHQRCRAVLSEHSDVLDRLVERLIEVEALEGDELLRVLGPTEGRPLPSDEVETSSADDTPSTPAAAGDDSEDEEEAPQGRPGIAWGDANAASPPPSD
jgi:cell division protease FtsH